jgi:hypothetical protein
MGADPMAVVGSQLRVHGITGLRIADASIMPSRRIPRHSLTRQRSGGHCHDQSELDFPQFRLRGIESGRLDLASWWEFR